MTRVINVNDRGTLTLPKELRRAIGLSGAGQVVAEQTSDGILIRAGATFPIEIYSDARIAEFKKTNEDELAGFRFRK